MIPTFSRRFRWFWFGALTLLLVTVAISGIPGPATWANPPDNTPTPQPPSIEPFSFQLEKPPSGGTMTVAAALVHPTAGGDWFELMSSGFEQDFQSEGWEVQGTGWERNSSNPQNGSYSAAVESFDGAPTTRLVYGGESGFSLDELANAKLDFGYWLDTDEGAYLGWAASADGVTFHGARTSGRVQSWLSGSLDLKHLFGDDSVWIAFVISGDGSGTNQNVFVDDVVIMGQDLYRTYLPLGFKNYMPPLPDFHDDFSDVSSGWPRVHVDDLPDYEEHRDYSTQYYDGHSYRMKLGGWTWNHRIFAVPEGVHAADEFTFQADLMYDYGDYRAEWGLIFEASDDMTSYYMVSLYRYGGTGSGILYRIRRTTPSEGEVQLVGDIAPGIFEHSVGVSSTIRIVREGNSIWFYVDNPRTGDWKYVDKAKNAPPLDGDRVGFTIFNSELGAEAWFDNFHLWQEPLHP